MSYSDFIDSESYLSKVSGSHIAVLLFKEDNPSDPVIGGATGINHTDDFETIPIEEAGNDGVDEIVQGRHTGSCTIQAFWAARRNDRLPTRQAFIGNVWLIIEVIAPGRPGAGNVVNAYTGCVNSRVGGAHGARGAKTTDLAFTYERRYNGKEWAALTGQ